MSSATDVRQTAEPRGAGAWVHVSADHPCPVCGKPDWCSVSADGTVAVCRRAAGGGARRVDKSGGEYWLHRLAPLGSGAAMPPGAALPAPPTEAAAPGVLDRAYRAALSALALSPAHLAALMRRGLPEVEVRLRGYRSLGDLGGAGAAGAAAWGAAGMALARVPGFRRRRAPGAAAGWVLSAHPGLIVPVRDPQGRIVALKVRRDTADGGRPAGPRYVYASSARWGGPGPGAPPHLPRLTAPPLPPPMPGVVRVTEGELKADVASVLSRVRTLSVAGVGAWRSALPVLRELGAARVLLAFDADAWRKPAVARALYALAVALQGEPGLEVVLERWDEAEGKGIDDLLAAGRRPEVVEGPAVQRCLRQAVAPRAAAAVRLSGVDAAAVQPASLAAAMREGRRLLGARRLMRLQTAGGTYRAGAVAAEALGAGMAPEAVLALLLVLCGGERERAEAGLRAGIRAAGG